MNQSVIFMSLLCMKTCNIMWWACHICFSLNSINISFMDKNRFCGTNCLRDIFYLQGFFTSFKGQNLICLFLHFMQRWKYSWCVHIKFLCCSSRTYYTCSRARTCRSTCDMSSLMPTSAPARRKRRWNCQRNARTMLRKMYGQRCTPG